MKRRRKGGILAPLILRSLSINAHHYLNLRNFEAR